MGLGKTVISLTAVEQLLYSRFESSKVLVIAPLRVCQSVWPREIELWDHLRHIPYSLVLGTERERKRALKEKADLYIINRENVVWLVKTYGKHWDFDTVIIDELSGFKSHRSQRFKALRKIRPKVQRMIGLTGTPTPNGLTDLWSQIFLLDQGERLGKTVTNFRYQFFVPGKRGANNVIYSWLPQESTEERIKEKISDICMSMSAEDWIDMPKRLNRTVWTELSKSAIDAYHELEREFVLRYKDVDVVVSGMASLTGKLLQLANGAVYYDKEKHVKEIHQAKIEQLEEILEDNILHNVLVFYSYRHDLDRLIVNFPQAKQLDSEKTISEWNEGKIPLLLAHPASAGHGLNLQAGGHIIIWFGLPWSLELYQQANARLFRQGQTETVIVHHLIARHTIEERVLQVLTAKDKTQDDLLKAVRVSVQEILQRYENEKELISSG